jgi:hypothetical protein
MLLCCHHCHPTPLLPAAVELSPPLPLPPPCCRCRSCTANTAATLPAVAALLPRCLCRSADAATALPLPSPSCRHRRHAACRCRSCCAATTTTTLQPPPPPPLHFHHCCQAEGKLLPPLCCRLFARHAAAYLPPPLTNSRRHHCRTAATRGQQTDRERQGGQCGRGERKTHFDESQL